jgi:hypothetical protein
LHGSGQPIICIGKSCRFSGWPDVALSVLHQGLEILCPDRESLVSKRGKKGYTLSSVRVFITTRTLNRGGLKGVGRRLLVRACPLCLLLALLFLIPARVLATDGGSKDNPDLQVGGFTVFGTGVTGATTVTSGWGNVYIDGHLQIHSNLHVGGAVVSTNVVEMGRQSLTQNDQWLTPGATIQPVTSYLRIRGETMPVSLGNPQIAPGYPGQLLTLQGTADLLKVTLVNGNGLRTNRGQPFTMGNFDTIQFIYDDSSGTWVEIHRSMNRWDF